ESLSTMSDDSSTTSKAAVGTLASSVRRDELHRGSDVPAIVQPLPKSARNIPYRFNAARTTCASRLYEETSNAAFSRNRAPIWGSDGSDELTYEGSTVLGS